MKRLIDIPEGAYKAMQRMKGLGYYQKLILDGTPLTGLTNGEVFMKMFPYAEIEIHGDTVYVVLKQYHRQCFDLDWWNGKWGE